VYLWIDVVAGSVLTLLVLGVAGSIPDSGPLPLLAVWLVVNTVLIAFCAVKIRRASRPWRNVTIVLMVLAMITELSQLPIGLVPIAANGVFLYLLASTESSQRFFRGE
jgi:hypothetical protein